MPTFTHREAAQELGIHHVKLQQYINKGLISAPPLRTRTIWSGAQVKAREWSDVDVERARSELERARATLTGGPSGKLAGRKRRGVFSTKAAAQQLGIKHTTFLNWITTGKISAPPPGPDRIRIWTEADLKKIAGKKPNTYRKVNSTERKRRENRQYQHERYMADLPAGTRYTVKRPRLGLKRFDTRTRPGPKTKPPEDKQIHKIGNAIEQEIPLFEKLCPLLKELPRRIRRSLQKTYTELEPKGYSRLQIEAASYAPSKPLVASRWFVSLSTNLQFDAVAKYSQIFRRNLSPHPERN